MTSYSSKAISRAIIITFILTSLFWLGLLLIYPMFSHRREIPARPTYNSPIIREFNQQDTPTIYNL